MKIAVFSDIHANYQDLESIINDIVLTQIPFSELSYKYSFSSPAYFTLFCKKHWGKAPNELRKENLCRVRKV